MTYVIMGIIGFLIGLVIGILIIVFVNLGNRHSTSGGYNGKIEKIKITPQYTFENSSGVDGSNAAGGFQKQ